MLPARMRFPICRRYVNRRAAPRRVRPAPPGERAAALADNDAAVDWLRGHLAVGEVVLVKASRRARLDEVAAALA